MNCRPLLVLVIKQLGKYGHTRAVHTMNALFHAMMLIYIVRFFPWSAQVVTFPD